MKLLIVTGLWSSIKNLSAEATKRGGVICLFLGTNLYYCKLYLKVYLMYNYKQTVDIRATNNIIKAMTRTGLET